MDQERRAAPRLRSTARILWSALGSHYFQIDRLRDVSNSGARIVTEAVPKVGDEIRFDLLDDGGTRLGSGLARVVRVLHGSVGIAFIALGVDAALVAALVAAEADARPAVPPPLPPGVGVPGAPPLPVQEVYDASAEAESLEDDEPVFTQIEPLTMNRDAVIIGIDLGTCNTCASIVIDGRPRIIPTATGSSTMPSVVHFAADGTVLVGHRAAGRQVLYPLDTVYGSKRLLGRTYRKKVAQEFQPHFAYQLAHAKGQRFGARTKHGVVSMDAIATYVLEDIRAAAEAHLGKAVDAAVITVPAYFSEVQRDAVRRAAKNAKLPVRRVVNEPTAAAVAYGHKQDKDTRIAVWDFGGGTFDVSIVDVTQKELSVVATGGDAFLGGADFDHLLAEHLIAELARTTGEPFTPDPQQLARVREAAELAKRALSMQTEHVVEIPELTSRPRRDLRVEITREVFDRVTKPLVERAVTIARQIMSENRIDPASVDDVVLVGGTSRLPSVQEAVASLFGRQPSRRINADEAVALGAALLADEIGSDKEPALLDVLPMTVGRGLPGGKLDKLVFKNARLPAEREVTVKADAQGVASLSIFQGESSDVALDEYVCSAAVKDAGVGAGASVVFKLSLDEHCTMAIEASDLRSGRALPLVLDRHTDVDQVLRALRAASADA